MANSYQRAVTIRKWTYFGLIIVLFAVSMFWRGKFAMGDEGRATYLNQLRRQGADLDNPPAPAPTAIHRVGDWLYSRSIEQQAGPEALELRELDQGDPEITSTAMRLGTLGSRGFVITALWKAAIEKFKRNEWHEFEFLVRTVTRLQPNFTTPWIYQSWNLSYNVSVENDRLNDMYFYIARGIELLAEGERMNRKSPDMRYQIGFYYQNKFSVSDKVRTLSSLFHLSCIKPEERNVLRFRSEKGGAINLAAFEQFAKKNPRLVRRLAEQLNYTRPEQIVQFLEDNRQVPTRYDARRDDRLFPPEQQFPVLPIQGMPNRPHSQSETDDTFDAFLASGSWYAYSMEPLPPTPSDKLPAYSPNLEGYAKFKYRIPKQPMLILFRQAEPRTMTYRAEKLGAEGWMDATTKWYPDKRADSDSEKWFTTPNTALETPVNSQAEFEKAYTAWKEHADNNGLVLSLEQLVRYGQLAEGVPSDMSLFGMSNEELTVRGLTRDRVRAREILHTYEQQRSVTNIEFFLTNSEAERDAALVGARKLLWDAKQEDKAGNKLQAKKLYAEGINSFRAALTKFPQYHRKSGATQKAEEDLLESQESLVLLMLQDPEVDAKARRQHSSLQSVVPIFEEDTVRQALAREGASQAAGELVTILDTRVQARAKDIIDTVKNPQTSEAVRKELLTKYPEAVLGQESLTKSLVTKYEYKYLWEFMSENSADDANRWVTGGTRMSMGDRLRQMAQGQK
jgi:hypothetical protein